MVRNVHSARGALAARAQGIAVDISSQKTSQSSLATSCHTCDENSARNSARLHPTLKHAADVILTNVVFDLSWPVLSVQVHGNKFGRTLSGFLLFLALNFFFSHSILLLWDVNRFNQIYGVVLDTKHYLTWIYRSYLFGSVSVEQKSKVPLAAVGNFRLIHRTVTYAVYIQACSLSEKIADYRVRINTILYHARGDMQKPDAPSSYVYEA
jgi:hypothetical protein